MARTVKVTIDLDTHETAVDLEGWQGKGCAVVTEAFEAMGSVAKSIKKPEYRQEVCKTVNK